MNIKSSTLAIIKIILFLIIPAIDYFATKEDRFSILWYASTLAYLGVILSIVGIYTAFRDEKNIKELREKIVRIA